MSQSRYEVMIALGFDQTSQTRAAAQADTAIKDVLRRMQAATAGGGAAGSLINPAEIAKLGAELDKVFDKAFGRDVRNSPLFQSLRREEQSRVLGAVPTNNTDTSRLLASQLRLARAELASQMVAARSVIPTGTTGTGNQRPRTTYLNPTIGPDGKRVDGTGTAFVARQYADDATRSAAQLSAAERLKRAQDAATKAMDSYAAEIQKELAGEQTAREKLAAARAKGALAIAQETAKREAAANKAIAAEEKADLAARTARIKGILASVQSQAKLTRQAEKALADAERDDKRMQEAKGREILAIEKRTAEAELSARRQGAVREARATPVSFPNADTATRVGRAQETVNIAERNRAAAIFRQNDVAQSSIATAQQVLAAENQLASSTRGLNAARQRLADEEIRAGIQQRTQQRGGTLAGQFGLGFRGASDRPFAEQIGQAFKFSVFYGTAYKALFAITQTFSQTLTEGIAFQQAVTELTLATGKTKEQAEELANQFAETATTYGFSGAQAALIGARAQGYYGTTDADLETQRRVGLTSAKVVNQIAFSSGLQPNDIQANLAAVTQAYQLGPQSQQYVGDLDAYFSKKFGIAQGQTISATSQAGVVGRAAGFSPAEVTALAADIISRTGASDAAAGGYLTQIFTRAGEGQLTALNSRYGIDNTQDFASQFRDLAKIYAERPDQRDDISAVFGRGKAQAAAISILQDFANITENVDKARTEAPGELDRASKLRLDDIGGQIQQTVGSLREFANQLSQSGVLDVVGAGVIVLRELADAGTGLLRIFNSFGGPMRAVIAGLTGLAVASRVASASEAASAATGTAAAVRAGATAGLIGGGTGLRGLASRIGARSGIGFATSAGGAYAASTGVGAGGAVLGGIAANQRVIANSAGRVVPYGAGAGLRNNLSAARVGLGGAASAVGGLGVFAAFAADAVLLQKTTDATKKFNDARRDYFDFISSRDDYDFSTSEGQAAAADQATNIAEQQRDAGRGVFASIKNRGADDREVNRLAKQADDLADLYRKNSELLAQSEATNVNPSGLIQEFSEEGIQAALDAVARGGGTAADQLDLLAASVNKTGDAAKRAVEGYKPDVLAAKYGDPLFKDFQENPGFYTGTQASTAGRGLNAALQGITRGAYSGPVKSKNTTDKTFNSMFDEVDIQARLQAGLETINSIDELSDPAKFQSVIDTVVGDLPEKEGKKKGFSPEMIASVREVFEGYVGSTLKNIQDSVNNLDTVVELTQDGLTIVANNIVTILNTSLGNLADSDYKGRSREIRTQIKAIQGAIDKTPDGEDNGQAALDLQSAKNLLAENRFKELEALRAVAESQVGGENAEAGSKEAAARDRQIRAITQRFARREIRNAVKNNSADTLAQAIANSGKSSVAYARGAIQDAMKIAIAAAEVKAQAERVASAVASGNIRILERGINGDLGDSATKAVKRPFQKLLNVLNTTASADPASTGDGAAADEGDTAAEIRAAKAAAHAAKVGGGLAAAASDITAAKAALEDAKPGTVAYFNALASLYTAQQSLAQAVIAYNKNRFLLGHDATDPLVQARAETYAAAAQLRADRKRGAGKDVLAEDRVALQSAQASQEQTKFQQRLDAVTTADDLGRISHSKYLAYLDHEHDRLNGIKNRTYQQQEQLDQIDKLMKDAANELDGQFNFGDIKLPTPYQVRRTIAERMDGIGANIAPARQQVTASPKAGSAQYVTFNIDGADTAKVEKIVRTVVGGNNTINVRTNAARRIR